MRSAVGLTLVVRVVDDELRAQGGRVVEADEVRSAEVRIPVVSDDLAVAVALRVDGAELRVRLQGETWRAESLACDADERVRELVDRSDEALRLAVELRIDGFVVDERVEELPRVSPARRSAELVLDEELERTVGVDLRAVGERRRVEPLERDEELERTVGVDLRVVCKERRRVEPLERDEELERTVGVDLRIVGDERRTLELDRLTLGELRRTLELDRRTLGELRRTLELDRRTLGELRRTLELDRPTDDLDGEERDTLREPELLLTLLRPELERPADRPRL